MVISSFYKVKKKIINMQPIGCIFWGFILQLLLHLIVSIFIKECMQNVIKKEIKINAPKQRVYEALTNKEQIVKWFPTAVEGNIEAGERPIFDFGEYGKNQLYIVATNPYEYFAYKWIPGSSHFLGDVFSKAHTLVEFYIEETDGVSTLTLTESGFSDLPVELAEKALSDNTGGWEYMLGRLEKYLA
jgi:uncharacterized protein YndB with AHSA1/START domain